MLRTTTPTSTWRDYSKTMLKFYKFYVQTFAHLWSRGKNQRLHHIINLRHCVGLNYHREWQTTQPKTSLPDPLPHASHLHLIFHPTEISSCFSLSQTWQGGISLDYIYSLPFLIANWGNSQLRSTLSNTCLKALRSSKHKHSESSHFF